MSAEECPLEIWEIIFSLACRDGGSTALALSQVSRSFNAYSKPYRYQSVALTRCEQIIAFGSVISSLPPELRRVRNLFVHSPLPKVYTSDIYDSDEELDTNNDGSQSAEPALPEEGLSGKASGSKEIGEAQDVDHGLDSDEEHSYSSDSEQSHPSDSEDSFDGLTAEEQAKLAEEIRGLESEKVGYPPNWWKIGSTPDYLKEYLSNFENHQYASLDAFRLILKTVASTLETLSVHFVMYQHCPLELIIPELPVLRDLSLFRMRPYHSNRPTLTFSGLPTVFPSLKRFQIDGFLEPSTCLLTEMAPSLECLHTNEFIFRKIKLFLPETLRKIVIHTMMAEDMTWTSHTMKRQLFGRDYEKGVGKFAEFVAEAYSEEYEVWMGDWLARINGEGDAVSIELYTDDDASDGFLSSSGAI